MAIDELLFVDCYWIWHIINRKECFDDFSVEIDTIKAET